MVAKNTSKSKNKKSISEKSLYLNTEIDTILFEGVIEYDAKDAGFSVIKHHKLLPEEEIEKISKLSKHDKNVYIGKLRGANPELSKGMTRGLRDAVQNFIILNKISDDIILSIKNDAVFIIGMPLITVTEVDGVVFSKKNVFTSYHFISGKEFYFNSKTGELVTKGVKMPEGNLRDFFVTVFNKLESSSEVSSMLRYLTSIRSNYIRRRLPIDWYRDIDSGCYLLDIDGEAYEVGSMSEEYLPYVNITPNYMKYILPLVQKALQK